MDLHRVCDILLVTIGTTVAGSSPISYTAYAGGQVFVPAGSSITTLVWYGSHDGVTYLAVQDGAGNAITSSIAASKNCLIPAACFACAFLKATGNEAGTINLSLKS
jgi:hypothetical protein